MTPAAALLAWYDRHRRDLPWRRQRDPWAIWLSEILLQQTRVETAMPYFERLLARFPTPSALAAAPVDELLGLWSGLGYYRRARQLHAAASQVVLSGGIPTGAAELQRLPGVGPYTAAAIASIAFGEPVAVLDGNVARVMARWTAEPDEVDRPAVRRRLVAAASALLDPARPGDSNQALMELGATVCLPRQPRCEDCPLAAGCAARQSGRTDDLPRLRKRAPSVAVRQTAALVRDGAGRCLVVQRGEAEAVLAGLWELPTVDAVGPEAASQFAHRFGGRWRVDAPTARVRHTITFRRLEVELCPADWTTDGVGEAPSGSAARWLGHGDALPALTGLTRKLLAAASRRG